MSPQPLLWPRQPGSGHGSHVGGGGSGQGSSRRSGGGGTGVNTAGAGGGAGGGSGGAPAAAGGGGGSYAAASAGGGEGSAAAVAAGGGGSAAATADCRQKFVIVSKVAFFTSDKEAFLCIRLRMTPQFSIDRSQRNSWVTMHALHVADPLHACCTHVACTSSYSFLMVVQYNMPSHNFGW